MAQTHELCISLKTIGKALRWAGISTSLTHNSWANTPVFWQWLTVKGSTPFYHVAPTREVTSPFRIGRRSRIIRLLPFRRALVVGWWVPSGLDEIDALYRALNLNEEHANAQSTNFDASVVGIKNPGTTLGRAASRWGSGRRTSSS